jgi:hypothetical protein
VSRGDHTGHRGVERARGGFRRGRGPITCHNFHQTGHYAWECPLPPTTCMYFCASDHDIEECPTLLVNIQEKRNQNNQNVQWILAEARDDERNINIVTRGGMKKGNGATQQELAQNQWVKKNPEPMKQFEAHKEKEIFTEARQEFQKKDTTSNAQQTKESPEYEMLPLLDHTNIMQPKGKVSTIK